MKLPQALEQYSGLKINAASVLQLSDRSWWVALDSLTDSKAGVLEGKLHLPADRTTKLVIFQPGFPGGAATDFERLHLKGLLLAGYAVFAARHRGTIINGPHAEYYINCPQRQEKAKEKGQRVLGNGNNSLGDWLVEPLIGIDALGDAFEEISLVGHSFGGFAVMLSATLLFKDKLRNHGKVRKVVSLAGVGGRVRSANDRTIERWHDFIKADWGATNRIEIGEPSKNVEQIRSLHHKLHEFASVIPKSVDVICLSAFGDTEESLDELIPVHEALDVIVSVGHGTLVIDTTQFPDAATGKLAHEVDLLQTSDLLKLVDPNWKSPAQIVRLGKQGLPD
ncbi:MAG TPA: hypothetical protein V6C97_09685 [Oculatellaceae cyanobacterium]